MNDVTRKVLIDHMEHNRRQIEDDSKRRAALLSEAAVIEKFLAHRRDESDAIREVLDAYS